MLATSDRPRAPVQISSAFFSWAMSHSAWAGSPKRSSVVTCGPWPSSSRAMGVRISSRAFSSAARRMVGM